MPSRFLFIVLLLLGNYVFAQPNKIILDHYSGSNGFEAKEALSIRQTSNALVWIGTNNGLAKYNSKHFTFFRHNDLDSFSITNNYCHKIEVDKRNWIWIKSNNDLDIFDTKKERCIHLKQWFEKKRSPFWPKAFAYNSEQDIMWVGTRSGLFYCKNGKFPLQPVSNFCQDQRLIKEAITTLAIADNETLWLTIHTNIIKLNTKTGATQTFEVPKLIDGIDNYPNLGNYLCSYLDKNKTLWLGTWCRGLIEFNTRTNTFHQYVYSNFKAEENTVTSIAATNIMDQKDNLWLSTYGAGLVSFNTNSHKIISYKSNLANDPNGIKGNTYGLYSSKDALWIGSQSGLHNLSYNRQLFHYIDVSKTSIGQNVWSISDMAMERNTKGIDEKLWFVVPYVNAYIYQFANNKLSPIPPKILKYFGNLANLTGLFIDSKNKLWISTNTYGLIGYDIRKDSIFLPEKKYFHTPWSWVSEIFEDADNNLWFGTFNGIFRLKNGAKKIEAVPKINDFLRKNKYATAILSITEDSYKNIFFVADYSDSKNAIIGKYNSNQAKVNIIYNEQKQSLKQNEQVELRTIVCNKNNDLFVTYFQQNIKTFKSTATNVDTLKILDKSKGLVDFFIDQLTTDTSGQLWLTNSTGLACYNANDDRFTNYNLSNNGLDPSGNPLIYFSPNTQRLYIAQPKSILYIENPPLVNQKSAEDSLLILQVDVLNKNGQIRWDEKHDLKLAHHQNFINLEYALINYTLSSETIYSWFLEGFDRDWSSSNSNIVKYNNLPPGDYILHLKAANSFGKWCTPKHLKLSIRPPFYKTYWFILLSVALLGASIYFLVQLRINRIREKYQLRNKIASDLHDEIGSTLTSINILSNVSQQAIEKQPKQALEMLEQISKQSKTIQQNMSDIVWSIRPDNEKIDDLFIRMREYAAHTLEPLNFKITFHFDQQLAAKSFPLLYRKDVLLIYKEAINNIVKHAQANEIEIEFSKKGKIITLTIHDNGVWKNNNAGTGTKTMQERAKAIGGHLELIKKESGTTVILNVPIP